jgi:hypothetical protein
LCICLRMNSPATSRVNGGCPGPTRHTELKRRANRSPPPAAPADGPNGEARSQNVSSGAPLPPAVELMPAQRAVFAMVSLLLSNEFSRNVVAQPQAQTLLTCFGAPLATPIRSSLTCSSLNPAIVRPLKPKAIIGF